MKTLWGSCAAALALAATPLAAQADDGAPSDEDAQALAQLQSLFAAEPLTAEQQARLPLAEELIASIIPDGAMAAMMDTMFEGYLGPLMQLAAEAGPDLSAHIGISAEELGLGENEAAEIVAIIDPDWKERRTRQMALMEQMMGEVMTTMEPAMRKGMSEAYAVNFTSAELKDIAAFFATESGATFARKSLALSSDPRIMGAAMQQMPAMMQHFARLEETMKSAMSGLGEPKTYDDLTSDEKARLVRITGLTSEKLRSRMEAAAAAEKQGPFD